RRLLIYTCLPYTTLFRSKQELEFHLKNKGLNNFELIEGDILKTIPEFLANNKSLKISLLHIDVDVYEPTKVILESLWDKVVKGRSEEHTSELQSRENLVC